MKLFYSLSLTLMFVTMFLSVTGCSLTNRQQTTLVAIERLDQLANPFIKNNIDFSYLPDYGTQTDFSVTGLDKIESQYFQYFVINNGIRVYFYPVHDLPLSTLSVLVEGGKFQMDPQNELLSAMLLKLLKHGTEKYSRQQFQQQVSLLGAPLAYRQTPRYSIISSTFFTQDMEKVFDLLAQQLAFLKPHKNALELIKQQQIIEDKLTRSSGSFLARQRFYQKNYPKNHPYHAVSRQSSAIRTITQRQLMDYYLQHYRPENITLVIVGDVNSKELSKTLERSFSHWQPLVKSADIKGAVSLKTDTNAVSTVEIIHRPGSSQANILYGQVTVPGRSEDAVVLALIARLLGGGPDSRLFVDLREQKGLTYAVSARQLMSEFAAPFLIQTSVAHDKVAITIEMIAQHINYLCQKRVSKKQLDPIKQQMTGELLLGRQSGKQRLIAKVNELESEQKEMSLSERLAQIHQVTPERMYTVTRKYLCKPHQFIVVGNEQRLKQTLNNSFKENLNE